MRGAAQPRMQCRIAACCALRCLPGRQAAGHLQARLWAQPTGMLPGKAVQEIMVHPWFAERLNPATLAFNDQCVAVSLLQLRRAACCGLLPAARAL